MKILQTKTAPNPRRVRVFLAEKGIEVPYEELDLMQGALKTAEFTNLNRFQRVPVLILDDGTAIAETMAICRYFEETKPEPALLGKGAKQRAVIEMWNRRLELHLLVAISHVFRNSHPAMAKMEIPQVAAWAEANKPRVLDFLKLLDDELKNRRYAAGDTYTVADITGMIGIDFMKPAKMTVPDEFTNVKRWHAEVSARPSAHA